MIDVSVQYKPEKPGDPRPNDEPYYIKKVCDTCGTKLVYHDSLGGTLNKADWWYDEFECPKCRSGIYLDLPEAMLLYMPNTLDLSLFRRR